MPKKARVASHVTQVELPSLKGSQGPSTNLSGFSIMSTPRKKLLLVGLFTFLFFLVVLFLGGSERLNPVVVEFEVSANRTTLFGSYQSFN